MALAREALPGSAVRPTGLRAPFAEGSPPLHGLGVILGQIEAAARRPPYNRSLAPLHAPRPLWPVASSVALAVLLEAACRPVAQDPVDTRPR